MQARTAAAAAEKRMVLMTRFNGYKETCEMEQCGVQLGWENKLRKEEKGWGAVEGRGSWSGGLVHMGQHVLARAGDGAYAS